MPRPDVTVAFVSDEMAGEALLASFLCIARVYACVQFGGVPVAHSLRVDIADSHTDEQPSVKLQLLDQAGAVVAEMQA